MQFTAHRGKHPCGPKSQVESKFQWALRIWDYTVIEYILHVWYVWFFSLFLFSLSPMHLQSRIQAQPDKGMWTTFDVLRWNDGRRYQWQPCPLSPCSHCVSDGLALSAHAVTAFLRNIVNPCSCLHYRCSLSIQYMYKYLYMAHVEMCIDRDYPCCCLCTHLLYNSYLSVSEQYEPCKL